VHKQVILHQLSRVQITFGRRGTSTAILQAISFPILEK